jgi:hypothetical protein
MPVPREPDANATNATTTKETATVPEPTTAVVEGQAPPTSGTPAQAATTSTATTSTDGQEPKTFDADYVKTLRAEAAAHRKDAAELRAKVQEHADAQLSETERLKKQASEAQAAAATAAEKATTRITRALLIAEASKLGFTDPADAQALIDSARIKRDADGEPTNLDELLNELATAKPYLVQAATGTASSAANGAARRGAAAGTLLEQANALLTPKSKKFWGL